MMMEKKQISFPRYERYKDSGISEIGKIPRGWGVSKFKYYYKCAMGETLLKEDLSKNGHIPVYSATEQDVIFGYVKNATILLQKGDLVIPARGNSIGNVKIMKEISTCTQTTIYARKINHILSKYVYFYLGGNKNYLFRFTQTAIPQITVREVSDGYLLVPPSDEQTAIAQFLDHKTAQIDRAIAIKEAQIKLLNERKQIMIQEAVTKGLDPSVPMKDSGVEWIGEIPAHWGSEKLGNLLNVVSERNEPDLPLLSITREQGIILRDIDDLDSNHNYIPDDLTNYKVIRKGQFGMNKMKAWQGSYGISKYDGIVSPAYYVFNLSKKIYADFFHHAIRSQLYIGQFFSASDGVRIGQWDLSQTRMANISFVIPPFQEQKNIVEYLERYHLDTVKVVNQLQVQIQTLKEYKTTLINEAVTGKIKIH